MFSSTKIFAPLHPTYLNRPASNFAYSGSDKENRNLFSSKTQQHSQYDTSSQSNHLKARVFNPLVEIRPSSSVNSAQAYDYTSTFSMTISNQNTISKENGQGCHHSSITKNKRTYCKDCGIFFPKSRAEVYREHVYKEKVDNHPDEVYSIMLEKQSKNREFINNADHLGYRKILVDWICEIGADHNFSCDTISIAISYIDTVFSKVPIPKGKLQLISLCCLIAAGKFSETDERVPSYKEIYELCKGTYPMDYFKQAEKLVFDTLNWQLKTITPYHFVQFYLSKGCAFSSDQTFIRNIDAKLLRYLRKYAEFFVDLSLKDYHFVSYKSSINACAAVAAARKAVGLFPLWTSELEELTEVSWREIEACYAVLYNSFEVAHPEIAKKANSYNVRKDALTNVEEHQSHAKMAIEGAVGTPFREPNFKYNREDDNPSSKKERATASERRNIECGSNGNRGYNQGVGNPSVVNVGIKLFKRKEEENMSIENVGEDLGKRDSFGNKIKRNLVF